LDSLTILDQGFWRVNYRHFTAICLLN